MQTPDFIIQTPLSLYFHRFRIIAEQPLFATLPVGSDPYPECLVALLITNPIDPMKFFDGIGL